MATLAARTRVGIRIRIRLVSSVCSFVVWSSPSIGAPVRALFCQEIFCFFFLSLTVELARSFLQQAAASLSSLSSRLAPTRERTHTNAIAHATPHPPARAMKRAFSPTGLRAALPTLGLLVLASVFLLAVGFEFVSAAAPAAQPPQPLYSAGGPAGPRTLHARHLLSARQTALLARVASFERVAPQVAAGDAHTMSTEAADRDAGHGLYPRQQRMRLSVLGKTFDLRLEKNERIVDAGYQHIQSVESERERGGAQQRHAT